MNLDEIISNSGFLVKHKVGKCVYKFKNNITNQFYQKELQIWEQIYSQILYQIRGKFFIIGNQIEREIKE